MLPLLAAHAEVGGEAPERELVLREEAETIGAGVLRAFLGLEFRRQDVPSGFAVVNVSRDASSAEVMVPFPSTSFCE